MAKFGLSQGERDAILGNVGILRRYRQNEPHFRGLAEAAYDMAATTLRRAGASEPSPIPESADAEDFLGALLNHDPIWNKICLRQLSYNTGQYVQRITELMADYLSDEYWATLVVRG